MTIPFLIFRHLYTGQRNQTMRDHPAINTNTLLSGLLVAALAFPAFAMETAVPAPESDSIEEITITGQRSLISLRIEAAKAEDVVYELFNELNTDDAYDVYCTLEARNFSHIKERHCRTGYELEALEAEAQYVSAIVTGQAASAPTPASIIMATELPKFQARMQELVRQNPALLEAVVKHAELREEFEARRAEAFGRDK
jgi:hypothetical protein